MVWQTIAVKSPSAGTPSTGTTSAETSAVAKTTGPETAPHKSTAPETTALETTALEIATLEQPAPNPVSEVRIVDHPEPRIHHPSNVAHLAGAALGIALTLLFAAYAHGTALGLTTDLQGATDALHGIFLIPVNVLEGLLLVIVPVAVLLELAFHRQVRQVLEAAVAAGVAIALAAGVAWLLTEVAAGSSLLRGLSVATDLSAEHWTLTIPGFVSGITALLVVAGPYSRRWTVRWSWRLLVLVLLIFIIVGRVSGPGALLVVFLGAFVGQAAQYAAGIPSERAYGAGLVAAIERAGLSPATLIRTGNPAGWHPNSLADDAVTTTSDSAVSALARFSGNRIYAMIDRNGNRFDVEVLDGDRQVHSLPQRLWRVFRVPGVGGRAIVSLKAITELVALLSLAAGAAGVRNPRLVGVGVDADSAALVFEHIPGAVALRDLMDLPDDAAEPIMADAWAQLNKAHHAGLAHHQLTSDALLVAGNQVWITGWDQGEIAASVLAKRLDLVQLLALFTLWVGPERALSSAAANLDAKDLAALSPLIQTVVLPREVRHLIRSRKPLLADTRAALINRFPQADQPPQQITRFNLRTVVMFAISVAAIAVVITTVNLAQIQEAVAGANRWWILAAIAFSLITTIGGALTLVAFAPGKLPFGKTVLAQLAGSFVALATPAGIGPAALNLRFLNLKKIAASSALAVVALTQVSQIVITVLMLVLLTLATGSGGLISLPSTTVLLAIGLATLAVIALLLVPQIRNWAWGKITPTLRQLWPRLSAMLSRPHRLIAGLGGNVLMSAGYVMSFYASLAAFGHYLDITDVAVIYLVGNTMGALIPTPGGLVGVEGALIAGLSAAGLPVAIGTSVTLLFRLVTYWLRIPLGWVALKYLESKRDL